MASSSEIATLITQGIRPPSGNQDVSYHTGTIVSWDRLSGVNVVEVNGVLLPNLTSLQNGMGTTFTAGDVVEVIRVQTKYFILGRVSAPNGLTGSAPAALTGGRTDVESGVTGAWASLSGTPVVQARIGNSCLVMFGASDVTSRNTYIELGLTMSGPASVIPDSFAGLSCACGMNNSGVNGPIIDFTIEKQVMFFKRTSWNTNGVPQSFTPGLYTFSLQYRLTDFSGGNSAIRDAVIDLPWITVIPF